MGGGRLLVVLGDVMGHGAGSAMITELAYGALNAFIRADGALTPARVLGELNQLLTESTTLWISMVVGLLDPAGRCAHWSSAGHPGILHGRQGARVDLLADREPPLGCETDVQFVDRTISIDAPTRFLVYSDGLIEATSASGRAFGRRQLVRAFERSQTERDWLGSIRNDFQAFAQRTFDDDVTAIAVTMTP
jgi:sigma-B regulation protein RsbU (phosphoserine phosphatase)